MAAATAARHHRGHDQAAPGQLLVAAPALADPNFSDTVVLILDVDEDGALGVVLNRPTDVPVGEVLPDWRGIPSEPDVLFRGGPVSLDGALAVGILARAEVVPVGFRQIADELGVVDLDTPTELTTGSMAGMRVYAGYVSWGAVKPTGGRDRPRRLVRGPRDRLRRHPRRRVAAVARRAAPPAR